MKKYDVTLIVYGVAAANGDQAYDRVTELLRGIATDCGYEKVRLIGTGNGHNLTDDDLTNLELGLPGDEEAAELGGS